jgi:dUTPase
MVQGEWKRPPDPDELCPPSVCRNAKTLNIEQRFRIAQLRIVQRIEASFEEVAELGEAARGAGGFGSTGK